MSYDISDHSHHPIPEYGYLYVDFHPPKDHRVIYKDGCSLAWTDAIYD